jgi:4,5-dihydroxyphthalate decarboxylase
MSKVALTLAMWDYDRVRPLMDGRVQVEGCDLNFFTVAPEECFHRAWIGHEFDICEIGFSAYIISLSRGEAPYVAIPVFPSRSFRHSCIYVRNDRAIQSPKDLVGKVVGVPEYQLAAPMWARGILDEEYGVSPDMLNWRQGGMSQPGRGEKYQMNLPAGFPLQAIPKGATLNQMLETGDLDAIIAPRTPANYGQPNSSVSRLFEDYESVEKAYFAKTKIFPIMHAIGIRNEVAARHPWLPLSLLKAFRAAKAIALRDLQETAALKVSLPWAVKAAADARTLMGDDWWPYGVDSSSETLQAMLRYSFNQGLSSRPVAMTELFHPSTYVEPKI